MSDNWNPQEPKQNEVPQQPSAPQEPQTPPYNGWSDDGGYRYVPPRNDSAPNNGYSHYQSPPPSPKPPRKKGNGFVVALAVIAAMAVIASVVFLGLGMLTDNSDQPSADTSNTDAAVSGAVNDKAPSLEITDWEDNDGGLSYKEIVNRNYDSTVVITTYTRNNNFTFGQSGLVESGSASGIVMSKDGYIITNWHCVINENTGLAYDRISVTTHNGKTYDDAKVIGADESTDLAVIKVDAKDLTVARFGDSSALAVGDRVVTLGNAAGLSWTATFGYVSALARDVYDDTGYAIKCLQVDAAINPGNSGGPLLNNQGMVVGINSAKIAATGYEGLGFSIPINEAKTIIDSLLKNGYVKGRVALGIMGKTISSGMYSGFLITEIDDDSSFDGTGVNVGDLIVGVNEVTVKDYSELRSELAKHAVGDKVKIKLLRAGNAGNVSSYTVTVTLKEQKGEN